MTCPFYASHRVRPADYVKHVTEDCDYMDRSILDKVMADYKASLRGDYEPAPPVRVTRDPQTGDEVWE